MAALPLLDDQREQDAGERSIRNDEMLAHVSPCWGSFELGHDLDVHGA